MRIVIGGLVAAMTLVSASQALAGGRYVSEEPRYGIPAGEIPSYAPAPSAPRLQCPDPRDPRPVPQWVREACFGLPAQPQEVRLGNDFFAGESGGVGGSMSYGAVSYGGGGGFVIAGASASASVRASASASASVSVRFRGRGGWGGKPGGGCGCGGRGH
ncbi:MAG: hypothetical protein U1E50_09910 [Caulobacteraceae bacterium]